MGPRCRHQRRHCNTAFQIERCWVFSPSRGTEQRLSRCTLKSELMTFCQDTCEGFGFQEESKVVALLNGVFTSYTYCCQFGVPCDCCRDDYSWTFYTDSSVVMWTRLAFEANRFPNVLNSTQESAVPAVVVDGKAGIEESHFVFSVARWFLVTTCPDGGPVKLSLAGSAWWRRREMRTWTRDKALVQPVSLPSSRTETWGKLPGSPARPCARFWALVSWCPGCVGGLGLWPSVPVLSVCPVSSCAPGLVALSGFVLRVCFFPFSSKRSRPRAPTQGPIFRQVSPVRTIYLDVGPAIGYFYFFSLSFLLASLSLHSLPALSTHRPGPVEEPPRAERALRGGCSSLRFYRPSSQRGPR